MKKQGTDDTASPKCKAEGPSGKRLQCACGSTKFFQKEVRKTGVCVIDGEVYFDEPFPVPSVCALVCSNCARQLPLADSKNFKFLRQFPEPLAN